MKDLPLEITMESLSREPEGSYLLADMRSEQERERGRIYRRGCPACAGARRMAAGDGRAGGAGLRPGRIQPGRGAGAAQTRNPRVQPGGRLSGLADPSAQAEGGRSGRRAHRSQPVKEIPTKALQQVHPGHQDLRPAAARRPRRRVHLRRQGLHAHGQAVPAAQAPQQVSV